MATKNKSKIVQLNSEWRGGGNLPVVYKYASFGILVQNVVLILMFGFGVWVVATADILTLKLIITFLVLTFFEAIGVRSLLRLLETIIATEDGVCRKTPFSRTHILWGDVSRVKLYKSWLERNCYKIESVNGDRITVSEMLDGYEKLYKNLEDNLSSSKFFK